MMGKKKDKKSLQSPADRVLSKNTSFAVREAYKTLRTNLEFSFSEKGSKALLFTSTAQGEGKSTSCLNTAITFGEAGFKTVLIDCDLRRPNINSLLQLGQKEGLSGLLTGHSQIKRYADSHPAHQPGCDRLRPDSSQPGGTVVQRRHAGAGGTAERVLRLCFSWMRRPSAWSPTA